MNNIKSRAKERRVSYMQMKSINSAYHAQRKTDLEKEFPGETPAEIEERILTEYREGFMDDEEQENKDNCKEDIDAFMDKLNKRINITLTNLGGGEESRNGPKKKKEKSIVERVKKTHINGSFIDPKVLQAFDSGIMKQ